MKGVGRPSKGVDYFTGLELEVKNTFHVVTGVIIGLVPYTTEGRN